MKGLVQRSGLREVCTDPDNGRVELASASEAERWATQVGAVAPERAAALAQEQGPALLETTEVARTAARQAFRALVNTTSDLQSVCEVATTEQHAIIEAAVSRPFVVPSDELREVAVAAVAALVRMGDQDVISLGQVATSPTRDPMRRLDQMLAVPHLAIWKVRILIDMIIRRDDP